MTFLFNVTGKYEKLWAAATGGRGVGRGRKRRIDIAANPENLSFGKYSTSSNCLIEMSEVGKMRTVGLKGYGWMIRNGAQNP